MRVAQIIDSLKLGGAQKLQVTLAQASKLRNLEFITLSLQAPDDSAIDAELRKMGMRVEYFPSRKLLNPKRIRKIAAFLREQHFDAVQTHLSAANVVGTMAAAMAGIPCAATLHSAGVDPRHYKRSRSMVESLLLRCAADRVLAVGHVVADVHRKRSLGKTIDVVPNAVTSFPQLSEEERLSVRKELINDPERLLLIAVGRLSPPKAYGDLLTAFATVREAFPHAALVIAGDGILREELQAAIERLRLNGHAFLLGVRHDVPRLLASSDVFVSSSHWEGLPVSVLEAMAAGLPVVATAVGDVPIVVPAHTGIVVPTKQPEQLAVAVSALLADPVRRRAFGYAARDHVLRNYGLEAWIDQLLSIYTEMCYPSETLLQEAR